MDTSVLTLSLYFFCISLNIRAEVFSSIYKIQLLIETQKSLIDSLENFIQSNSSHHKILEKYLQRLKFEHNTAIIDVPEYVGNPVNSFRLIKRLTIDVEVIKQLSSEIIVLNKDHAVTYPREEDLLGAAEGLFRLQMIYGLNKNLLANGIWNTSHNLKGKLFVEKFNPMTITDCYELSKALYKIQYYTHGIEWLKVALDKKANQDEQIPEDDEITAAAIKFEISKGHEGNEKLRKNFELWFHRFSSRIPNFNKLNPDVVIEMYKKGLQPSEAVKALKGGEYNSVSLDLSKARSKVTSLSYGEICRGYTDELGKKIVDSNKCYFAHGPHPFLILAPLKAEHLQSEPNITLFYDVINDAETQALYKIAKPRLKRNFDIELTKNRICQVATARSNDSLVIARLRARMTHITGMNLIYSEQLQIINYGIGGHYSPHYDYWLNDTVIANVGNRIATVVFYMSKVKQGGATAFPRLGLTVFPVKGAALFWTNLLPSGHGNPLTYHTACPVLRGSKWIATQWINLRGQELNQPCPLTRM